MQDNDRVIEETHAAASAVDAKPVEHVDDSEEAQAKIVEAKPRQALIVLNPVAGRTTPLSLIHI